MCSISEPDPQIKFNDNNDFMCAVGGAVSPKWLSLCTISRRQQFLLLFVAKSSPPPGGSNFERDSVIAFLLNLFPGKQVTRDPTNL